MTKKTKKMRVGLGGIGQSLDALGRFQDNVNQPVSNIINGITKTFNRATRVLGSQPLLEEDPTAPIEAITEGFNIVGDSLRAINSNLQEALRLDPTVAKELIKLGEKGDQVCDASKGDLRMTIEFPSLGIREFNACVDMKTARNLANQITTTPIKPIQNFAECAIGESILKPVDHVVRDIKNGMADVIGAVIRPAQVVKNIKNGVQNIVDVVQKGFAGTYLISPNADSLVCFQAKTNGVPFKTVNIGDIGQGLISMKFLRGQKIEMAPFSNKEKRNSCCIT